jgi:release factor glutamine methyltransferase
VPAAALASHRIEPARERHDRSNRGHLIIERRDISARLREAGFVAADDEARELVDAAHGDDALLEALVARRLRGEPVAWIVGYATFCGRRVRVADGVYVPRWQSEPLARRAVERLPSSGVALDVCTGSGAIAVVLRAERPGATILATELDDRAVECARTNGVDVYAGDLFAPLPSAFEGRVDVIVAVVPYVPTSSLPLLPRDTLEFETTLSYDGGDEGVDVLRRVVRESGRFLRPGGALLLEVGGDEADVLRDDLEANEYRDVVILRDDDGDVRALEATRGHVN